MSYDYVIGAMKIALTNKLKDVEKYDSIVLTRQKEMDAAMAVSSKACAERDELINAINLLNAKAARDDE